MITQVYSPAVKSALRTTDGVTPDRVLAMSEDVFQAIAAGVQVAFDGEDGGFDPDVVEQVWRFFVRENAVA